MRVRARWIRLGVVGALALVIAVGSFLVDEPIRRYMESAMNRSLADQGYRVELARVSFHPIGLSVTLRDLVLIQVRHPDPPVLHVPRLDASVQWRALLHAALVADFRVDSPVLTVNRPQLAEEAEKDVPVEERKRSWQQAVEAIYPLKIDLLRIVNGDVTYIDAPSAPPLHLGRVNIRAGNIRNVASPDRVYPSDLSLEANVFDTGRLRLTGNADFLAEPHVGVKARIDLDTVSLGYFRPILRRHNFELRKGTLSAVGEVEYAPRIRRLDLQRATLTALEADYVRTTESRRAEKRVARKAVEKTGEVSNEPEVRIRAKEVRIVDGNIGWVDRSGDEPFRLFLADSDLTIENVTNHLTEGTAVATLKGKFMGSGETAAKASFRAESGGPRLDLSVKIENTDMRSMNQLWERYANLQVDAGQFSFYSELNLKDRAIRGYVKPLFRAVDVREQRERGVLHKVYQKAADVAAKILRNRPRREVATVTDISGSLDNPETSSWQAVQKLIQNAFFKAILPGFRREAGD